MKPLTLIDHARFTMLEMATPTMKIAAATPSSHEGRYWTTVRLAIARPWRSVDISPVAASAWLEPHL